MQKFYIRDSEQARAIVRAYKKCGMCSECILNGPEGWRCSYLYECAREYLDRKTDK